MGGGSLELKSGTGQALGIPNGSGVPLIGCGRGPREWGRRVELAGHWGFPMAVEFHSQGAGQGGTARARPHDILTHSILDKDTGGESWSRGHF